MSKKPTIRPDYADIKTLGIPRALLYYRYSTLWKTFFADLGVTIIESDETDRAMVERGESLSVDECCLAFKIFMGHVDNLMGRCDAIFVPAHSNFGDHHSFCTKFQSLPDLVGNIYHHEIRVVSCMIEVIVAGRTMKEAFEVLAQRFGASEKQAKKIVKHALDEQDKADRTAAYAQKQALAQVKPATGKAAKPRILVVAHPYVTADPYLGGTILAALETCGAQVFLAHETDHNACYKASLSFTETMPWQVNRELIGSILSLRDQIDGVVLVSAFPCGPDSMTNDAVMRCITGLPILNLTIDAQTANAGVETRVESFVDILTYQGKGGYV